MKREIMAVAAATGVLYAGMNIMPGTASDAANQWVDPPTAEAPLHPANTQHAPEQHKPVVIDLGSAALRHVPPAVSSKINSAAAIRLTVSTPAKANGKIGEESAHPTQIGASGVATKFGFISSGHDFFNYDTNVPDPTCQNAKVIGGDTGNNGSHVVPFTKAEAIKTAKGDSLPDNHETDISVIRTPGYNPQTVAPLHAHNVDLPVGTPLTAVNYMPTGSGSERAPDLPGKHGKPAILREYVLQDVRGDSDQIVVLSAVGPSLGTIYDSSLRAGASGGPNFTDDGIDIGQTTAITQLDVPVSQIERDYGVDVRGAPYSTAQLTFIQPVNASLIAHMQNGDNRVNSVSCG